MVPAAALSPRCDPTVTCQCRSCPWSQTPQETRQSHSEFSTKNNRKFSVCSALEQQLRGQGQGRAGEGWRVCMEPKNALGDPNPSLGTCRAAQTRDLGSSLWDTQRWCHQSSGPADPTPSSGAQQRLMTQNPPPPALPKPTLSEPRSCQEPAAAPNSPHSPPWSCPGSSPAG